MERITVNDFLHFSQRNSYVGMTGPHESVIGRDIGGYRIVREGPGQEKETGLGPTENHPAGEGY